MSIHVARQQREGHLFHMLVFDKTIIPVAQIKRISYRKGKLQIEQPAGTLFEHPCSAGQWARVKKAFLEGV